MRSLLLACSLLLPACAAFAATDDVDQLMSLLAQRREGHVAFTEQHFVALLDRPVESSGELFYTAPDKLEWRVTVEDASTWTRPWTFSIPLTANDREQAYEYACHEGNYGLSNILSAARAAEKDTAAR